MNYQKCPVSYKKLRNTKVIHIKKKKQEQIRKAVWVDTQFNRQTLQSGHYKYVQIMETMIKQLNRYNDNILSNKVHQ